MGPYGDSSYVNEARLRASSQFVETLISEEWKCPEDWVIRLPEHDFKVFSIYYHWFHNGDKPLLVNGEDIEGQHVDLAEAYVLGRKLIDRKFQNRVIDAIAVLGRTCTSWWAISYLYTHTTPDDPIRRLLVDMCAGNCEEDRVPNLANFLPFAFRDDLYSKLAFLRDTPNAMNRLRPAKIESWNYHHQLQDHGTTVEDKEEQNLVCVGFGFLHLDQ